jgi:EmrB/QacA subfamily drug resistance transporter
MTERKRWLAFYLLCAGEFMIVIDTTIINVALPSMQVDLAFTESSLVWVVNAYMVTYGGFLLLGGRLGDLYGSRRWFLLGTALFTAASLVCALANTQWLLVVARAVQGLGGAAVSAIALSLIMNLFSEAGERAKAMGIYGFICAGGGSVGVLAGGVLTSALSWHWVFLVNLPIGALVCALCFSLLSPDSAAARKRRLDVWGALTVTASSMLAIYAIVNSAWPLLLVAVVLFAAFLIIESRVGDPLMPLRLFRIRSVAVSNVIGVLWAAAMFAWFFISALYMQLVLGYTPLQIGLAFLPSNLIMAAFSIGLSAKLVMRFGLKLPIAGGMLLTAAGLGLLALAPSGGGFVLHVLPGMLLLGIGCGMALNPVMLAAMSDVEPSESGLASGVVNTSFMMGGALGLAALASLAEARGYHAAFAAGALFAALAAGISFLLGEANAVHDHREGEQGQRGGRDAAGLVAGRDGQVP